LSKVKNVVVKKVSKIEKMILKILKYHKNVMHEHVYMPKLGYLRSLTWKSWESFHPLLLYICTHV